jgi:hypothetical protein
MIATEGMEYKVASTTFKVVDGVICGPNGNGEYTNKYPGYACSTVEKFQDSVGFIFDYIW